MWIKAKLHSGDAPTIIRINPFLNGNRMGQVDFLKNYRAPGYKVEGLRIPKQPVRKRDSEIQWDWRRWFVERTVKLMNSISFSLTLMAQDSSAARNSTSETGLAAVESSIKRWWKWQRASWAKRALQQWEEWENIMLDELYTTR
jgi:hypothetical protein